MRISADAVRDCEMTHNDADNMIVVWVAGVDGKPLDEFEKAVYKSIINVY